MIEPTFVTRILVLFGAITLLPLLFTQLIMLLQPRGKKAKNFLIGNGEEWRDKTHFRSAYGFAWADWILLLPLLVSGSIGVLLGQVWGYLLWAAAGAISLYINIALWVMEKEYVYPSRGPVIYFTYYCFFLYIGELQRFFIPCFGWLA